MVIFFGDSCRHHQTIFLEQVVIRNFSNVMEVKMKPFVPSLVSRISTKKRVGVLISGSGTNLQALTDSTQTSNIGAEIVLVMSNKDKVEGLKRAERANIPTKVIDHRNFPNREDFDKALLNELVGARVEIVCLAGFMRILTGEFTSKWKGKLINVHPALLPLCKGTHAQKQVVEAGVTVSGCTVHFVDETVDGGLIIVQEAVPVYVDGTEEMLTEKIKVAEHKAFPRALELVATDKIKIGPNDRLVWTV
jgi:phosphoribosylamine--glycine ligase/phosphoribosylglycinamide formyltransferase/phosphoribosylformylglycinamidine cyclo-ligase